MIEIKNKNGDVIHVVDSGLLSGASLYGVNLVGADLSGAKICVGNRVVVIS